MAPHARRNWRRFRARPEARRGPRGPARIPAALRAPSCARRDWDPRRAAAQSVRRTSGSAAFVRSTSSESRRTSGSNRWPFSSTKVSARCTSASSGAPTIFIGVGDISSHLHGGSLRARRRHPGHVGAVHAAKLLVGHSGRRGCIGGSGRARRSARSRQLRRGGNVGRPGGTTCGGTTRSLCPATPARNPATTSTVMLIAG